MDVHHRILPLDFETLPRYTPYPSQYYGIQSNETNSGGTGHKQHGIANDSCWPLLSVLHLYRHFDHRMCERYLCGPKTSSSHQEKKAIILCM